MGAYGGSALGYTIFEMNMPFVQGFGYDYIVNTMISVCRTDYITSTAASLLLTSGDRIPMSATRSGQSLKARGTRTWQSPASLKCSRFKYCILGVS